MCENAIPFLLRELQFLLIAALLEENVPEGTSNKFGHLRGFLIEVLQW